MLEFYNTRAGRELVDRTLPRIANALERIADALGAGARLENRPKPRAEEARGAEIVGARREPVGRPTPAVSEALKPSSPQVIDSEGFIALSSIKNLAALTAQVAYSADRVSLVEWIKLHQILWDRGYSHVQIEAIVRSKMVRRALDTVGRSLGEGTARDILNYMDNPKNGVTHTEIESWVRDTQSVQK